MSLELIKNAIAANGFVSTDTAAGYINPTIWNTEVLRHTEAIMVLAAEAKVYDDLLGAPGDTLNVTVSVEPTVAAAVAESDDVSISEYNKTQVVFTPTEYAAAYQLSDKESRRAFFNIAGDMTRELGYSLALLRENTAISTVTTNAGNAIIADGVLSSAIAASNTLDYNDIVNAQKEIRRDKFMPKKLFVSVGQMADLQKDSTFRQADQFGGREVILGGLLTKAAGLEIYFSTQISESGNKAKAILLGVDIGGQPAFGIARKSLPTVRSERHELGRYTDFVAVEEWDMKVLRPNAICTIETYVA